MSVLCREKSREQLGRGAKGCAEEGDRDGRTVGDGKRGWAGLGRKGLVGERRDPHSTGMGVGIQRPFFACPRCSVPYLSSLESAGNRESYGQGV